MTRPGRIVGARALRPPAKGSPAPAVLRVLPARLTAPAIRDFALIGLVNDVAQDRRVWATKRHLVQPAIAEEDGPIGPYRRWADQFLGSGSGSGLGLGGAEGWGGIGAGLGVAEAEDGGAEQERAKRPQRGDAEALPRGKR